MFKATGSMGLVYFTYIYIMKIMLGKYTMHGSLEKQNMSFFLRQKKSLPPKASIMATSSVVTGFVWPTETEVPPIIVGRKCLGKICYKEANMGVS